MLLRDLAAGGRSGVEDCLQRPEVFVPHDTFEAFLGPEEGRSHTTQDHLGVLPVGHAAGLDAYSSVRALDDVGGGQAAVQRRRDVQPVNGEVLLHAFQQTGRRLRILLVQPCGQFLDARDALVGVQFPGRPQQAFDLRLVVLGQIVEHVPQLVGAAALHLLVCTDSNVPKIHQTQRVGSCAESHCRAPKRIQPHNRRLVGCLRHTSHRAFHRSRKCFFRVP